MSHGPCRVSTRQDCHLLLLPGPATGRRKQGNGLEPSLWSLASLLAADTAEHCVCHRLLLQAVIMSPLVYEDRTCIALRDSFRDPRALPFISKLQYTTLSMDQTWQHTPLTSALGRQALSQIFFLNISVHNVWYDNIALTNMFIPFTCMKMGRQE